MKVVKRSLAMVTASLLLLVATACTNEVQKEAAKEVTKEVSKKQVIATLFPQYDFIKEIAKDKVEVKLLLPPGMEPHAYDPTPRDIANISKADMFVYTGEYMEPWAQKIIDSIKSQKLEVVDVSKGIHLIDEQGHQEEEHQEEKHGASHAKENHKEEENHGEKDPHIWIDPVLAQNMVDNIVEGLIKMDATNTQFYKENGKNYKASLAALDQQFTETFTNVKTKTIVSGGHFVFGYFVKRYGLSYVSAYDGFAPDAEPTPQNIVQLINTLKSSGSNVIYHEENVEPKIAKVISAQTGAKMLLLHGVHNISKEELENGTSYVSIMKQNLENLKVGLGYTKSM